MTLQHSASGHNNIDAYRNSQPIAKITTEPTYPMTTNNRDAPINIANKSGTVNLRKKPPGARQAEVEDLPSDISADEWGEI